jgi:hypothetical protein
VLREAPAGGGVWGYGCVRTAVQVLSLMFCPAAMIGQGAWGLGLGIFRGWGGHSGIGIMIRRNPKLVGRDEQRRGDVAYPFCGGSSWALRQEDRGPEELIISACVRVHEGIHAVPSQPLAVQFVHARTPCFLRAGRSSPLKNRTGDIDLIPPKGGPHRNDRGMPRLDMGDLGEWHGPGRTTDSAR